MQSDYSSIRLLGVNKGSHLADLTQINFFSNPKPRVAVLIFNQTTFAPTERRIIIMYWKIHVHSNIFAPSLCRKSIVSLLLSYLFVFQE